MGDSINWPGFMGPNHTSNIESFDAQEQAPAFGEPAKATFRVRIGFKATKGSKTTTSPVLTNSATPFRLADSISPHGAFVLEKVEHTLRVSGNTGVSALLQ